MRPILLALLLLMIPALAVSAEAPVPAQHAPTAAERAQWEAELDKTAQQMSAGNAHQALPEFERLAALLRQRLGESHELTIGAMGKLGTTYSGLGQHPRAIATLEEASQLAHKYLGAAHSRTLIIRGDLATALVEAGDYPRAIEQYKVLAVDTELALGRDHTLAITVQINLALALLSAGDVAAALPVAEKAWATQPGLFTSSVLSKVYIELHRLPLALQLTENAAKQSMEQLGPRHAHTLALQQNAALILNEMGRYAEAAERLRTLLPVARELYGEKHISTLTILHNLAGASLFVAQGDLQKIRKEALPLSELAYNLRREVLGDDHPDTLLSLNQLGVALYTLDDNARATEIYERIYQTYLKTGRTHEPQALVALANLAAMHNSAKNYIKAAAWYDKLVNEVEVMRREPGLSPENRQALFAAWVRNYRAAAKAWCRADKPFDGLRLVELTKARTLLERTAVRLANQSAFLNAEERAQLQHFENQITLLNEKLIAASNQANEIARLEVEKNQLVREYAALRTALSQKNPAYARLNDISIVTIQEGGKSLGSDDLFLNYLVDGDHVLVIGMTNSMANWATLGHIEGLNETIDAYRRLLADPEAAKALGKKGLAVTQIGPAQFVVQDIKKVPAKKRVTDARIIATALSQALLPEGWQDFKRRRHWIISPDGPLAMLPFETLLVDGKPLIETHDVSYAQSLSVHALLKQREAEQRDVHYNKTILALGGARYEIPNQTGSKRGQESDALLRGVGDPLQLSKVMLDLNLKWDNLPATRGEAKGVAALLGDSDVLLGPAASEAKLNALNQSGRLRDYRYLHFATHGYLNTRVPELSALVLDQVGRTPEADGYLTMAELPAYSLNSELTVLSACQTGLGKQIQGEGVLGVPYALYVAGNRNTLMTLWSIADEGTAVFMKKFYTRLKNGETQVKALNNTKREFIKDKTWGNPFFWAPFVLYGV